MPLHFSYFLGRPTSRAPRDPFVRIYLMPNEKTIQQSRVHKQTNDPIFNETFKFEVKIYSNNTML